MKNINRVVFTVSLPLLVACSASRPASLDLAGQELERTKNNPFVVEHAPHVLNQADSTYELAVEMWNRTEDPEETTPLAKKAIEEVEMARIAAKDNAIADSKQLAVVRDEMARKDQVVKKLQRQNRRILDTNEMLIAEIAKIQEQNDDKSVLLSMSSDLLFDSGESDLKPGAKKNLLPLASYLAKHPAREVVIEGHTDNTGTDDYNLNLSTERAASVGDYLKQMGQIDPERITVNGMGEKYPIASNDSQAGRLENRRVEVKIQSSIDS